MTKAAARVELTHRHRQRRDFRRTGVVRLAEAGATTPPIAAVSGHRIDRCQNIIDTYLPRRGGVGRNYRVGGGRGGDGGFDSKAGQTIARIKGVG